MAVPTYVNKGTFAGSVAATNYTVPTGYAADDLLIIFFSTANQNYVVPSGWTDLTTLGAGPGTAGAAASVRACAVYKIATASESTVSIADVGDIQAGIMMAFRGVDTTSPIHVKAVQNRTPASTSVVYPTVTTTVDDCLIILFSGQDTDANSTATMTVPTNAALSSITELHDQTTNTGVGGGVAVAVGEKATAGVVGTSSATQSTSLVGQTYTIALTPAPTPPPPVGTSSFFVFF